MSNIQTLLNLRKEEIELAEKKFDILLRYFAISLVKKKILMNGKTIYVAEVITTVDHPQEVLFQIVDESKNIFNVDENTEISFL